MINLKFTIINNGETGKFADKNSLYLPKKAAHRCHCTLTDIPKDKLLSQNFFKELLGLRSKGVEGSMGQGSQMCLATV